MTAVSYKNITKILHAVMPPALTSHGDMTAAESTPCKIIHISAFTSYKESLYANPT